MLSTEGIEENLDKALKIGARGFIVKPVSPEDLLFRVKREIKIAVLY